MDNKCDMCRAKDLIMFKGRSHCDNNCSRNYIGNYTGVTVIKTTV